MSTLKDLPWKTRGNTLGNMLLLAVLLAVQSPVDSVHIVTRDIPNFWRAYDLAAGKDSPERVRIFETVYLQPGSPGLRDWMRERLMNRDTVRARLIAARSEEHTSELQSHVNLVCRLLLEKKKKNDFNFFFAKKNKKTKK